MKRKTKHMGSRVRLYLGVLFATGMGVATMFEALATASPAYAGPTCTYPMASCDPFSGTSGSSEPVSSNSEGSSAPSSSTSASSSTLPLTGADLEQLAVVGAGAILIGGLVLRRRRRRYSTQPPIPGFVLGDRTVWSQWQSASPSTRG